MTWAKVSDTFIDDPVLLALPRGVRLLYVEGTVWSCKQETDGQVPAHVVGRITDEPDPLAAVEQLVDAGLWDRTDDGFVIVGFELQQRSSEELEAARKLNAVRQERHRRHRSGDHSKCNPQYCKAARDAVSDAVTDGVSNGSLPDLPDLPDLPVPSSSGGTGSSAAACADGACDGTGWITNADGSERKCTDYSWHTSAEAKAAEDARAAQVRERKLQAVSS